METNVNYTVVGVFVIALMSFIVVSIIWLSSGLSGDEYTLYRVYMKESVSGLAIDSAVEYNGVNVGAVKSVELNRKNPQLVELLLSIKSSTPITKGTMATLNVKGLTGIGYMGLQDKGTDRAPLTILPGEKYPVIKTAPSFFLRLDTAVTKLNDNFQKITVAIGSLLDNQNLESFKQILIDARRLSDSLANNTAHLDAIFKNSAIATQQFPKLFENSRSVIQEFSTQTLPAANRSIANINTITTNLTGVSNEIKQNPSLLIRGRAQPTLGPGE